MYVIAKLEYSYYQFLKYREERRSLPSFIYYPLHPDLFTLKTVTETNKEWLIAQSFE